MFRGEIKCVHWSTATGDPRTTKNVLQSTPVSKRERTKHLPTLPKTKGEQHIERTRHNVQNIQHRKKEVPNHTEKKNIRQRNEDSNKQASKKASKQANNQATKQANRQTNKQNNQIKQFINKQASKQKPAEWIPSKWKSTKTKKS